MARIYKRGDRGGYWYMDVVSPSGKRIRKKLGRSERLAREALYDYEIKRQRGELGFDIKETRIEDFFTKSLDYSKAINSVSQAERMGYVVAHFKEFLATQCPGLVKLSQLAPEVFLNYQQQRLCSKGKKTRKPLKKKTVNIEIKALKTMFNRAVEWGLLRENPCRVRTVKETDSKKVRSLTEEEVITLLEKVMDHWLYPVIYTMVYAGLRLGECRFLNRDDIDFKKGIIHIRRKEGWIPKSPGGEIRERDIYIGKKLVAFLQRHKLASNHADDLVFHDSHGNQLSRTSSIPFGRLMKELKLGDVTAVHALRHTYITHLIRTGADIVSIQEQAGHKSILTTRKYIDCFEEGKRKAAQGLDYGTSKPGPAPADPRQGGSNEASSAT